MTHEIVRLTARDFEEAMDFLNLVFSQAYEPHDFERLLPKLYQPTDEAMGWNRAIRKDGRIRAIVGLFPMVLHAGGARLPVAGIGGVSSHPKERGNGLMTQLMRHCLAEMRSQGVALSYLAGQRQRYGRFGYETCGVHPIYTLTPRNFKDLKIADAEVGFNQVTQDLTPLTRGFWELHEANPLRWERRPEDYFRICTSWKNGLHGVEDGEKRPVGYLVAQPDGARIVEIDGPDEEIILATVDAWLKLNRLAQVTVLVNPLARGLRHRLGALCEGVSVEDSGCWQVFDWAAVVGALLRARAKIGPLVEGRVVIDIVDQERIVLEVSEAKALCAATDDPADIVCTASEACRLLFGPLSPSTVLPLPDAASVLEAWCPLPLFLAPPDGV